MSTEPVSVTTPVATATSLVTGLHLANGAEVYRGIPYASAPVGRLRFAPAQPPRAWTGVRAATRPGPASLQPTDMMVEMVPETAPLFLPAGMPTGEDCLTLDVWSPGTQGSSPVLVWIHGGGWATGTAAASWSDGARFAVEQGVVVVGINYRLGLLGHLDLSAVPGGEESVNLGIRDQIAALRWVRSTIHAFGGDPDRVTVSGESAGAFSAVALLGATDATGLFSQVIAQSGHGEGLLTPGESTAQTARVLDHLGIAPDATAMDRLRALPARAFVDTARSLRLRATRPVADGRVLSRDIHETLRSGASAGRALLVGSNRDESRSFRQLPLGVVDPQISTQLVRELLAGTADPQSAETAYGLRDRAPVDVLDEASNDRDWLAPIRRLARAAETGGLSCFVYEFVWPTSTLDGRLGSAHQAEIPFVFNTLDEPGVAAISGSPEAPGAREHARFVSDAWGAFVRHGVPGDPEPWPRWGAADTTVVLERGTATASEGHRAPALDLWDGETG